MPDRRAVGPRLQQVARLLEEEARERILGHPAGHLARGRGQRIELRLALPIGGDEATRVEVAGDLGRALDAGIRSLVAARSLARPGHAYCLRCAAADCEHSSPVESREVFRGYGPTGQPRFGDFGQLLLERKDPRIEKLYAERRELVVVVLGGRELASELLPEFRDVATGFRVHGQVCAGYYRAPDRSGLPAPLAISLQVISTQVPGARRRLSLNVVGIGPCGEPLASLATQTDPVPWAATARWAQTVLEQIERAPKKRTRGAEGPQSRIDGLLKGIARRLEQGDRAKARRTSHAATRHEEGDRPTRMAVRDLVRASDDAILIDTRHGTVVALGERGRAHVFNLAGKLVTSLRLRPQAIERRRKLGIWRDATAAEVRAVRDTAQAASDAGAG